MRYGFDGPLQLVCRRPYPAFRGLRISRYVADTAISAWFFRCIHAQLEQ
jgi:hypothetical protein